MFQQACCNAASFFLRNRLALPYSHSVLEGNREAKMILTRNLNMIAFFVAFLFLTAIVLGIF